RTCASTRACAFAPATKSPMTSCGVIPASPDLAPKPTDTSPDHVHSRAPEEQHDERESVICFGLQARTDPAVRCEAGDGRRFLRLGFCGLRLHSVRHAVA